MIVKVEIKDWLPLVAVFRFESDIFLFVSVSLSKDVIRFFSCWR